MALSEQSEERARTTVMALLQILPFGGAGAQVLGHAWTAPAQRRIESFCGFIGEELQRLRIDIAWLKERIEASEPAQVLSHDAAVAALRSTSEEERHRIARLLVRGLNATDLEIANAEFLLRAWQELDDVEKLIFLNLSRPGFKEEDLRRDHPEVFGDDYLLSNDSQGRFAKDDMHTRRMQHMMTLGVLRPKDEEGWRNKRVGYQFRNFWPTKIGEELRKLLVEEVT